ncbi:MAG: DNA (cytosine-5-)-methyltransferase, partial [Bacteroidia bacterium]|nr:DNA (cytosine-5-)-methyltransferase [Bacteroidia bacterium]
MSNKYKVVELFAGVGGFRVGLEASGVWEVAFANQWEPGKKNQWAFDCYTKHFKDGIHSNIDIAKVDTKDIPDHTLLVGGFPCQSLSIAGKRGGFDDTRGTLFFDIARILSHKRPRHFLLENVKGLLSHDSGKTFQTILRVLTDIGYYVEWQVLNSKNFGVPQNRGRVFLVGHLGGLRGRKVFPLGQANANALRQIIPGSQGMRVYDNNCSTTIAGLAGGWGAKTGLYAIPELNGYRIRRLTPVECARLQGFPDDWHEGVSDSQAYRCYGNAVTVNVIEAIITR